MRLYDIKVAFVAKKVGPYSDQVNKIRLFCWNPEPQKVYKDNYFIYLVTS